MDGCSKKEPYKAFNVRGFTMFVDATNGEFSLFEEEVRHASSRSVGSAPPYSCDAYKSITFCLEIVNACNLRCAYCFNPKKDGKRMSKEVVFQALETLFQQFSKAERYFIDVSGDGEPLLNLPLVEWIADYAKTKSDFIDREVTVTFVTNGVLLSSEIASRLQHKGILFGVSLDGHKANHDRYRVDQSAQGTYDTIMANVKSIKDRQYVGCAVTITKDVFPLTETIHELKETFKTISIKPVRSVELGLDENSLALWKQEYEKLEKTLELELEKKDTSTLFCLLNGDDYFGKFVLRAFLNLKALSRCDCGTGRIAVSVDGNFYPCPAMVRSGEVIGNCENGLDAKAAKSIYRDLVRREPCRECPFLYHCGGECLVVRSASKGNDRWMCEFKKELILLAMLLEERCREFWPDVYRSIIDFCVEKIKREGEDPRLREFRMRHPELTFTEAKERFDRECPKY